MNLVFKKFTEYFSDVYGNNDEKFIKVYDTNFFQLYLKSIINGTKNYYLKAQTRYMESNVKYGIIVFCIRFFCCNKIITGEGI